MDAQVQSSEHGPLPWSARAFVLALALALAAAVGWATAPYGPGGWHFAMNNIAAADHLLAGDGVIQSRGNPFLSWPPLLPALIATLKLCGLRYVEATWWIAIASAFAASYFHGRLLLELSRRAWVAAAGTLLVWSAPGFFRLMCSTLSQPLFIALGSAGAWALVRWTVAPSTRLAVALGGIGAAASLHRYDGLVFVPVCALVMASTPASAPFARRVARAALVAVAAALAPMAWLLRNRALSGSWTGERARYTLPLSEVLADLAHMARVALAPALDPDSTAASVLSGALMLFALLGLVCALRRRAQTPALAAALFPLAYGAALALMASRVQMDRLSDRLAQPLVPPLLAAVALGLSERDLWVRAPTQLRRWAPALLCGAYALFALSTRAAPTVAVAQELRAQGAGGFASARWQDSELALWLRAHPLEGALFSNAPEAVLLGADRMPDVIEEDGWEAQLDSAEGSAVLILSLARRRDRRLLERIGARHRLRPLVEFEEAGVYRVEGRAD